MSNWEPGVIPISANFQNNTAAPLEAKSVVANRNGLNDIQFAYRGLVVFVDSETETYLCISTENLSTSYNAATDEVNSNNWKKINDDSLIDGGVF
tara:strand:- start:284 stop:568 length:285 start_codon:yes stop_codon:yes gene_type:complete